MKITIGNQVFTGEGVSLARKIVKYQAPKKQKSFAIIGETDDGETIFRSAVKQADLPYILNEIWDYLQPKEEKYDCLTCPIRHTCPLKPIKELDKLVEELLK